MPRNRPQNKDYVTYEVSVTGGPRTTVQNVCYREHMTSLRECELWLVPDTFNKCDPPAEYALDGPTYMQWIDLHKQAGIVPHEIEPSWDDKGIYLHIPRNTWSRATIYLCLCLYRWAESMAAMADQTVAIAASRPDLDFYQVLHYTAAQHIYAAGHSWHPVAQTVAGGAMGSSFGGAWNLANSLAMVVFCGRPDSYRHDLKSPNNYYNYTSEEVALLGNRLAPTTKIGSLHLPHLLVNGNYEVPNSDIRSDILNPRWTVLYKMARSIASASDVEISGHLAEAYAAIEAADPEIGRLRESLKTAMCGYQSHYRWNWSA